VQQVLATYVHGVPPQIKCANSTFHYSVHPILCFIFEKASICSILCYEVHYFYAPTKLKKLKHDELFKLTAKPYLRKYKLHKMGHIILNFEYEVHYFYAPNKLKKLKHDELF
jgi:hypothetical protein